MVLVGIGTGMLQILESSSWQRIKSTDDNMSDVDALTKKMCAQ